ncbi:hypothetical protein E5288_WYG019720 [Bos mutus]|uniref:Uncharacterized protein n=1 Tax=Bos mutus TaxID=72004 RepID=A0A6B0SC33_9CETA|nr:hypothetical protein [Bos mutus]
MEENVSADDGNMAVFSSSNKGAVIVNRRRQGLVSQAESEFVKLAFLAQMFKAEDRCQQSLNLPGVYTISVVGSRRSTFEGYSRYSYLKEIVLRISPLVAQKSNKSIWMPLRYLLTGCNGNTEQVLNFSFGFYDTSIGKTGVVCERFTRQ